MDRPAPRYAYAVVDTAQGDKIVALRLSRLMCRHWIAEQQVEGRDTAPLRVRRAKVILFGS